MKKFKKTDKRDLCGKKKSKINVGGTKNMLGICGGDLP